MAFPRQEYWSGLLFPSPGDLPTPSIEPGSPALQADYLPTELQGNHDKTPAPNNEDGLQQMILQYGSILAEHQYGQKYSPGSKSCQLLRRG